MLAELGRYNQRLFDFRSCIIGTVAAKLSAASPSRVSNFSVGSPNYAPRKRVGTHNGSVHCDEALGCFMIRLTDKFAEAEVVQTRFPKVLGGLDVVLDVSRRDLRKFLGMASQQSLAVLVIYKHFGNVIIAKGLQLNEEHPDVYKIFLALYRSFMEWKLHLFELEEELKIEPLIKYVLYEAEAVIHVNEQILFFLRTPDKFENLKALASQWRRIPYLSTCGFIVGNKTYEGALATARASLKL